jgi:hypothetical protein
LEHGSTVSKILNFPFLVKGSATEVKTSNCSKASFVAVTFVAAQSQDAGKDPPITLSIERLCKIRAAAWL